MKWLDKLIEIWDRVIARCSPFCQGVAQFFRGIGRTFSNLWKYIFWFRSVVLGAPLGAAAVILAAYNRTRLPETLSYIKVMVDAESEDALMGLFVMTTEYISRDLAVAIPMLMTAVCIVLMLFSKRMLFPFMIGLLTLALPQIIYWFTIFPM